MYKSGDTYTFTTIILLFTVLIHGDSPFKALTLQAQTPGMSGAYGIWHNLPYGLETTNCSSENNTLIYTDPRPVNNIFFNWDASDDLNQPIHFV